MRYILGFFLLLFLVAIGIFAIQNTQTITVKFLNWGLSAPLALLAIGIYLLGMLSGWSVVGFLRRSLRSVSVEDSTRYNS